MRAALLTIALGLSIHRGVVPLAAPARDIAGDAAWAVMIYWWLGALHPRTPWPWRGIAAVAVCWLVEFSQLAHTPALDVFRATTIGHLLLGSGFDPRDLLSYAVGVLCATCLDVRPLTRARADPGT